MLLVNISGKVTSKNPNSEFAAKPNRGRGTMKRNEGEKRGVEQKLLLQNIPLKFERLLGQIFIVRHLNF